MIISSSSSVHLHLLATLPRFIFTSYSPSNILSIRLVTMAMPFNQCEPALFLVCPLGWLMQHIHKHPGGMLAEMWKKIVGVHCRTLQSQRFVCELLKFLGKQSICALIQRMFCRVTPCLFISAFPSLCVVELERVLETGVGVSELGWSGGVNSIGLAQWRSVVDWGSEVLASAWAFRRSTMSWWEAASAADWAVCPF